MRGPSLLLRTLVPVLCLSLGGLARAAETTPARDDTLAYFENLPDTNPYRRTLLLYQRLPAADRDALKTWSDAHAGDDSPAATLTPGQAYLASEFSSMIAAAASTPSTTRSDWPLLPDPDDPTNPAAIILPGVGTLRTLARITVKNAASLPADQACVAYAAVAQLARQQRSGATLIEQLTGVAIEGIAQSGPARRLAEFSADDLRRWQPPAPVKRRGGRPKKQTA